MTTVNISYTGVPTTNTKMRTIYTSRDGSVVVNGGDWVALTVTEHEPATNYCIIVAWVVFVWMLVAAFAHL